jgi:hypothetical protein
MSQRRGEVPAWLHDNAFQAQPLGFNHQFTKDGAGDFAGLMARFDVCCSDHKSALWAIRLEIESTRDGFPHQEREDIVAPLPLRFGRVDLDAVIEAEQPRCPRPEPNDGIEGR